MNCPVCDQLLSYWRSHVHDVGLYRVYYFGSHDYMVSKNFVIHSETQIYKSGNKVLSLNKLVAMTSAEQIETLLLLA